MAQKIIGGGFLFLFEELIILDKASLDIFWLRDENLEDSDNLSDPGILAQEIVEDLGEEKDINELTCKTCLLTLKDSS